MAGATEAINATEFSIMALKPFRFSAKVSIFVFIQMFQSKYVTILKRAFRIDLSYILASKPRLFSEQLALVGNAAPEENLRWEVIFWHKKIRSKLCWREMQCQRTN